MSNNFTIDQLTKSQSIYPNSINRLYELNMMLNFMDIRSNNPRMTQNQICKQLGTSDSIIKRYRDDIKMDSPYKINYNKKKIPKQKPAIITENISNNENSKSTIDDPSKNKIIEKRIKNRLKNDIKGGSVSNKHILSTNEIIDYAFQNNYSEDRQSGKELIEKFLILL